MASGVKLPGFGLRLCHMMCSLGQVAEPLLPQFPIYKERVIIEREERENTLKSGFGE